MMPLDVRCLYTGRWAWMVMSRTCKCLLFPYHLWSYCDSSFELLFFHTFFDLSLFELSPKGGTQTGECLEAGHFGEMTGWAMDGTAQRKKSYMLLEFHGLEARHRSPRN